MSNKLSQFPEPTIYTNLLRLRTRIRLLVPIWHSLAAISDIPDNPFCTFPISLHSPWRYTIHKILEVYMWLDIWLLLWLSAWPYVHSHFSSCPFQKPLFCRQSIKVCSFHTIIPLEHQKLCMPPKNYRFLFKPPTWLCLVSFYTNPVRLSTAHSPWCSIGGNAGLEFSAAQDEVWNFLQQWVEETDKQPVMNLFPE